MSVLGASIRQIMKSPVGSTQVVKGWVRSLRAQKKFAFVQAIVK